MRRAVDHGAVVWWPSWRSHRLQRNREAIEKALDFGPQAIFLLSENITGFGKFELDRDDLLAYLDRRNKLVGKTGRRRTRINCIQFLDTDPIDTLQEIVRIHGGPDGFRILKSADLGLE